MSQHGPLQQDLLIPSHDIPDETAQVRVLQETQIFRSSVRIGHELDLQFGRGKLSCTNTSMPHWVLAPIETTIFRVGSRLEYVAGRICFKVAPIRQYQSHCQDMEHRNSLLSYFEHIFSRNQVLDEDIAILLETLSHLWHGRVFSCRTEPSNVLSFDLALI